MRNVFAQRFARRTRCYKHDRRHCAMDVRATVEQLAEMKVRVHCLALGGVDLTSAAGKMTMAVIAAVAEGSLNVTF